MNTVIKITIPSALTLILLCTHQLTSGQLTLNLDSCYVLARNNYPLIHQFDLIEKSKGYTVENAGKGKLPSISLSGQATYQSDVTKVPIPIPNIQIPSPTRDQYNLHAEIAQSINDLYTTKDKVAMAKASAGVEAQKTEVELYKLRDRVNQLYFGILLMDAQLEQTELLKKAIQIGIDKVNASIANGTAIKSSAAMLEAELLNANQHSIELKANRKAYLEMLTSLTGLKQDDDYRLESPQGLFETGEIMRPELRLYELQKQTFDLQKRLLTNDVQPKLGLFLQTGVGKPALNFLKSDFDFYYLGGVRVNWNLTSRYTYRNQQQLLVLNQQAIDVQQQTFIFNTNLMLNQQHEEIMKLASLIAEDDHILALRKEVTQTTSIQLENGTATVNDYITNINAEDQARQNQAIHEIQLRLAQYNLQYTTGH